MDITVIKNTIKTSFQNSSNSSNVNTSPKQWIQVLLYLILFIIIFIIIYFFIQLIVKSYNESKLIKKYNIILPKQDNGKNFKYCPIGCKRGICGLKEKHKTEKPLPKECQYDFECQYCEDRNTHQFYVGGNYENQIKIIPTYEQKEIRKDDLSLLNHDIEKNNIYIHKLNKKIKYENSKTI